ncbi:MAG: maleylpyruvate isomerase family mycothiol-dependent enzyme [Ilumatobacteraceae bacterium]|nr:maleylpyruvate isomerase family mycothiol-dependent enzyme [Ilumatobacteraceae bacterium]
MVDSSRILNAQVVGCAASHQRLLQALDGITDKQCRQPSLLTGWSRGHVLSHLANNAYSHLRMFEAASRGEETEQYEGGKPTRDAQIEAWSSLSAHELVGHVRASIYALEGAWASATPTTWTGFGIKSHAGGARVAITDLMLMRWCETEVHSSDLNLDYSFESWDSTFVRFELDRQLMIWNSRKSMGLTVLPEAAAKLSPNHRLAWLLGRIAVDGLPVVDAY